MQSLIKEETNNLRGKSMKKCEECIHSRLIVSENGYHHSCCLSSKAAIDCMMGKKSQFVTVEKNESGNIKVKF